VRQVVLKGRSVCRSRFELLTDGNEASADGERVSISRPYLSLARNDDEVAFLLGHELAHNILRHRAWLDKVGRSNVNSRIAERAADRLAVWLMANAGYDIAQAPAFMEHWGRRQGSPLLREASHDHWKARQKAVGLELAKIAAARALHPDAPLDWRAQFPR
jgi:Zn-dependent protease with chaperone function